MKPVSNGAKAVFAVAFALFLAVVLVGIALSDNPVKKFFKQQEVLDIAKMHMSQVKSGEVYTGALQFADDIDFDNLALSQVIPIYSARQNGDVVRDENEGYAVYSNGKVVALFGICKCDPGAVTGGTTMSNVGLEVVQNMLSDPGTCALLQPCDSSGALYVTPHSSEAVEVFDPGPSFPGEPPEPPPASETVTLESVGITSGMISQIDFPEHQDPVPFSV